MRVVGRGEGKGRGKPQWSEAQDVGIIPIFLSPGGSPSAGVRLAALKLMG